MKKNAEPNFPYKTGEQGYNRESGKKTLFLVGTCILLIVVCLTISLLLLLKR